MRRSRLSRRSLSVSAVLVLVAAVAGGCASTESSPTGGGATSVDVTLQEWSVNPSVTTATAGEITFSVTNDGPEDVHEFVVLTTDLDPGSLPVDEHGAVDEEGEGITVVDEIEDIPVGETEDLTVTLEAGSYVLLCNIYDADEGEAHYQMGMRSGFEVTD